MQKRAEDKVTYYFTRVWVFFINPFPLVNCGFLWILDRLSSWLEADKVHFRINFRYFRKGSLLTIDGLRITRITTVYCCNLRVVATYMWKLLEGYKAVLTFGGSLLTGVKLLEVYQNCCKLRSLFLKGTRYKVEILNGVEMLVWIFGDAH